MFYIQETAFSLQSCFFSVKESCKIWCIWHVLGCLLYISVSLLIYYPVIYGSCKITLKSSKFNTFKWFCYACV